MITLRLQLRQSKHQIDWWFLQNLLIIYFTLISGLFLGSAVKMKVLIQKLVFDVKWVMSHRERCAYLWSRTKVNLWRKPKTNYIYGQLKL